MINPQGILVVGADTRCGKTVAITGLASALIESGFRVQTLKPLSFHPPGLDNDQPFINKITGQYLQLEPLYAPSAWDIPALQWNRMLEQCRQAFQYPFLLEAVGQVGSPWQLSNNHVYDSLDFAQQLHLSVLLVAQTGPHFMERARVAIRFIQSRGMDPVGFIAVSTHAEATEIAYSDTEALALTRETTVAFLGHLPYSPSISVAGLQQGNLIRLTEEHIDLLPIQFGMGLTLAP